MLNNEYSKIIFHDLSDENLSETNGGAVSIIIGGVIFTGWKAGLIIASGVTTLAGALALGVWNGYNRVES